MILVRIFGGLGNQLFQYAFARAVSLSTDQQVLLDVREAGSLEKEKDSTPRAYCLDHFRPRLPVCRNVERFYPYLNGSPQLLAMVGKLSEFGCLPYKFYKETDLKYKGSLLTLKGNWYLEGWFQDSRYFRQYRDVIAKEILPRKKIKISHVLAEHLRTRQTVSVHIRRGDFKKDWNVLPVDYYYRAMECMAEKVPAPFWIVFSDEIEWVKTHMDFGKHCYFIGDKEHLKDEEEFMVMRSCRHHIIANSTYSWWGAWLGRNEDEIVIGPDKWFLTGVYSENIMPEEWARISVR